MWPELPSRETVLLCPAPPRLTCTCQTGIHSQGGHLQSRYSELHVNLMTLESLFNVPKPWFLHL